MKKFLLSVLLSLSASSLFAQANFISTAFYNSTTCEVTIQVGLQRKNDQCNSQNTIGVVSVDFSIQWSDKLQLVSSSFIPSGAKLDDSFYYSEFGQDNGLPKNDTDPTGPGNPTSTRTIGSKQYKSYNFRRSTSKCDNIILLQCGMIVPFFTATFKIECAIAQQYSYTYNHANPTANTNYIAEFNNGTAAPTNGYKEILIVSSQTESFSDVAGQCKAGDNVKNDNTLATNPANNNFVNTYGAVLPVILDYFKGEKKQSNSIQLEWTTLSEQNTAAFVVEKSTDQKNWTSIATVQASGNSNSLKLYQVIDRQPHSGNNYYRLRQVDFDGWFTYSETVRVTNLIAKNISIFPNPVNEAAQLFTKEPFKPSQIIQLIDAKGTRLKTINLTGGNRVQIEMNGMAGGLYLIQLMENGRIIESVSVIKQ